MNTKEINGCLDLLDNILNVEFDDTDPDYKITCTCVAFPEQFDVIHRKTNELCGYIRLRWGFLECEYIKYCRKVVFCHTFDDDPMKGMFDNKVERQTYLNECLSAIRKEESK